MEFLIALVIIAAAVFAVVRLRRTFGREIDRAKRIKRSNDNGN
jgi:hypothetical protein